MAKLGRKTGQSKLNRGRTDNGGRADNQRWFPEAGLDVSVIPRVVVGAVNGAEVLAIGAIQLARNTLTAIVGGTAELGTRAVTGTAVAARGIVGTTFEIAGEAAGVATNTVRTAVTTAKDVGAEMKQVFRRGPRRPTSSEIHATTKSPATQPADATTVGAEKKRGRVRKAEVAAA